jgi:hypothetical protein
MIKVTIRVFEDIGGYYYCDDSLPYLDTRGQAYKTKAMATRVAIENGDYKPEQITLVGSGVSRFVARQLGAHTKRVK